MAVVSTHPNYDLRYDPVRRKQLIEELESVQATLDEVGPRTHGKLDPNGDGSMEGGKADSTTGAGVAAIYLARSRRDEIKKELNTLAKARYRSRIRTWTDIDDPFERFTRGGRRMLSVEEKQEFGQSRHPRAPDNADCFVIDPTNPLLHETKSAALYGDDGTLLLGAPSDLTLEATDYQEERGHVPDSEVEVGADLNKLVPQPPEIQAGPNQRTAPGSDSTPTTVDPNLVRVLNQYGSIVSLITQMVTADGNEKKFPWIADNQEGEDFRISDTAAGVGPATTEDIDTLDSTIFRNMDLSSKFVRVHRSVERDLGANTSMAIRDAVMRRMGKRVNNAVINSTSSGDWANRPPGILQWGQSNDITTAAGQTDSVSIANLLDMVLGVGVEWRENTERALLGWAGTRNAGTMAIVANDDVLTDLVKTTVGTNDTRPAYLPAWTEAGMDRLHKWPIVVNSRMPATAAGSTPAMFVNGAYAGVRFIGPPEIHRFWTDTSAENFGVKYLGLWAYWYGPLFFTAGTGEDADTRNPTAARLVMASS